MSLYSSPVFFTGWLLARARGIRTMFRTLATFDSWVKRKWWKESLKRFLFRRVDGVETPGSDGFNYSCKYGTSPHKIFLMNHTIDIPHFYSESVKARSCRQALRKKYGLKGVTFLYVGRLWVGKGLHYLLDGFNKLQRQTNKEISLLLVGDGPDENNLKDQCRNKNISNVVFAGFQKKNVLPQFYAISDVFVFPTLGDPYGLVVDEAMSCCLPVISTSSAGEIRDRIEDTINGYIIPPNDSNFLADRMKKLVKNQILRNKMGKISAKKVANHTPEKWAENFENAIKEILKSKN